MNAPPSEENGQAGKWIGTPTEGMEVFLEIGDAMDMDKERARIRKEVEGVGKEIEKSQAKLGKASFIERAKPEVVEEERQRLAVWLEKRVKLEERQKLFGE